jgi:hypothetical protein
VHGIIQVTAVPVIGPALCDLASLTSEQIMKARPAVVAMVFGGLALLAAGSGCSYEAASHVGGREVSARTSTLNGVSVRGGGESAQLVVGLCAFHVTERELRWRLDHVLDLPEGWNTLQLVRSGRHVLVRIDGQVFRKIDPAA